MEKSAASFALQERRGAKKREDKKRDWSWELDRASLRSKNKGRGEKKPDLSCKKEKSSKERGVLLVTKKKKTPPSFNLSNKEKIFYGKEDERGK